MKRLKIKEIYKKRFKSCTDSEHDKARYPNRLNQYFDVFCPNQAWVSDINYIATQEGWLYLAVAMDLYSRKVIG